jgi:probable rRNA maturation factor
MAAVVAVRNRSVRKRLVQRRALERLAGRICAGEQAGRAVEISVLLCDDDLITELNRKYRRKNKPTDVLSFEQDEPAGNSARALGDIVISLETAERNCGGERAEMRREIEMLFCHGLLHLLGYDHGTAAERAEMQRKQAQYLGRTQEEAWKFGPKRPAHGGNRRFGR